MHGCANALKAEEFISDWVGRNTTANPENRAGSQNAVEFIGDSYFVGYGNLLPESSRERDGLSPLWIDRFTDHRQGMAALCGQSLNRQHNFAWRVVARSGRGMVRNYPTLGDRTPLSVNYAQLIRQLPSGFDRYAPKLIAINLGTNDFSTPIGPAEPFADVSDLQQAFISAYHRFLDELSRLYPGAVFLLVGVRHPSSRYQPSLLRQISESRRLNGDQVHFCCLPEVALTGCDGHPGIAGHRACAQALTEAIELIFTTANNKLAQGANHAHTTA